ncbi:recombination mediator RecR [Candidatus Parcubacteria bacterium]|nr:recombination mediator RecR [Candidatus Parcubacteria bacterium]
MSVLPKALNNLIEALGLLPGVGPRSAERFAYFLFKNDLSKSQAIAQAITSLSDEVKICPVTFALIDAHEEVSRLYSATERDKQTIMVVADPFDVAAIEKTNSYKGTYHVLNGLISPIDGVTPETLHIAELVARVKKDQARELILATNASVEGESTAHFIAKQLESSKVQITRLAQGLPIGLDIEYADQITLGKALEGRRAL